MTDDRQAAWAAAGRAAASQVQDGMRVGLGTGRAAAQGIRALGARVREGMRVTGVPTSPASAALARAQGIRLGRLDGPLDLAFDGADAIDPRGLTVKGAGGAMVRERAVAQAADRFLVLVDGPKLVVSLDEWGVLPLAVVPFCARAVARDLADLGPVVRPRRSDDGLVLCDLHVPAGSDWEAVAARARARPGVVDHGLFVLDRRDVLVGRADGTAAAADPA
ncbi:MAG: ribose 5-phosphate isomerase A [Thermoleophilia bacterium]|nr:ribose 5-phosphate isomerase A [Thermoleophilia bacterium]